jgi:hypothetical protein
MHSTRNIVRTELLLALCCCRRPSPTNGTLGGIALHTNDVVLLCEAARCVVLSSCCWLWSAPCVVLMYGGPVSPALACCCVVCFHVVICFEVYLIPLQLSLTAGSVTGRWLAGDLVCTVCTRPPPFNDDRAAATLLFPASHASCHCAIRAVQCSLPVPRLTPHGCVLLHVAACCCMLLHAMLHGAGTTWCWWRLWVWASRRSR